MSLWDNGETSGSMLDQWSAALGIGDGTTYTTGKTNETVPTDAIGSMTPVTQSATTPGWEKFMQDTLGGLLGYAVKKDAIKSGISVPASQSGGAVTPTTGNEAADAAKRARWNMILIVGGVVAAAGVGLVVYKLSK